MCALLSHLPSVVVIYRPSKKCISNSILRASYWVEMPSPWTESVYIYERISSFVTYQRTLPTHYTVRAFGTNTVIQSKARRLQSRLSGTAAN